LGADLQTGGISEDFAELKREHNAFGWLVFGPELTDLPDELIEEEAPTASERLRKRKQLTAMITGLDTAAPGYQIWHRETLSRRST
jgi:hypothetical protein